MTLQLIDDQKEKLHLMKYWGGSLVGAMYEIKSRDKKVCLTREKAIQVAIEILRSEGLK